MSGDSFTDAMASLTLAFRGSLPGRLAEMRRLADSGSDALPALRASAHKLAGQGGVFGAPAVGAAAATLEDAAPENVRVALARLTAAIEELG